MLTRHFYDAQTVQAAFLHAVTLFKHPLRRNLLLFWCYELWLSEEYNMISEMLQIAFMHCGCIHPAAIKAWRSAITNPRSSSTLLEFLGFLTSSSALPPSYGPPSADRSAVVDISVGIPKYPSAWTEGQRSILLNAVYSAIRQNQGERVYRFLSGLPPTTALQYLPTSLIQKTDTDLLGLYKQQKRGLSILLVQAGLRWPHEQPKPVTWPKIEIGRLSARLFQIPRHLKRPTMTGSGLEILEGCRVWIRLLTEHGVDIQNSKQKNQLLFQTDEECEEFYKTYFPDDIPDEWTDAEYLKSHNRT